MADLIPNGTYHIRNVAHTQLAVDLNGGLSSGAIFAFPSHINNNQKWNVTNLQAGSNRITLDSLATPQVETYASVISQTHGAGLTGSPYPVAWTVEAAGNGQYRLLTRNRQHAWYIRGSGDFVTIWLEPLSNNPGNQALWTFTPV